MVAPRARQCAGLAMTQEAQPPGIHRLVTTCGKPGASFGMPLDGRHLGCAVLVPLRGGAGQAALTRAALRRCLRAGPWSAPGDSSQRGRGRVTGGVRAGRVRGEASRRGIVEEALASRKATAGPWSWVARSAARRKARGGPRKASRRGATSGEARGVSAVRRSCSGTVVIAEVDGISPAPCASGGRGSNRRRKALRVAEIVPFDEGAA